MTEQVMGRTLHMMQARPSQGDIDAVVELLAGVEMAVEEGLMPMEDGDEERDLDDCDFVGWLSEKWRTGASSWGRVIYAGLTALQLCDPDSDVVTPHPNLQQAVQIVQRIAAGEQVPPEEAAALVQKLFPEE